MLYRGFNPLMSRLSDRNMRLGDVMLPPGIKQWCLYLWVQGLFTLRKVLLMQLSVALSYTLGGIHNLMLGNVVENKNFRAYESRSQDRPRKIAYKV